MRSVIWNANRKSICRNKPTVLDIPGLNTDPFPKVDINQIISIAQINSLKLQFENVKHKLEWKINEKSSGVWRVAHLINQGEQTKNLFLLNDDSLFELTPNNKLFGAAFSELSHDFRSVF